jgi:Integral membrane protein TerC family
MSKKSFPSGDCLLALEGSSLSRGRAWKRQKTITTELHALRLCRAVTAIPRTANWRYQFLVVLLEKPAKVAISAERLAAKTILIVFGLATSVPLIIAGSALLMKVMARYPVLVWAGAALLGWVAGEIISKDTAVVSYLGQDVADRIHVWAAAAGAIFVMAVGWLRLTGVYAAFRSETGELRSAAERPTKGHGSS